MDRGGRLDDKLYLAGGRFYAGFAAGLEYRYDISRMQISFCSEFLFGGSDACWGMHGMSSKKGSEVKQEPL